MLRLEYERIVEGGLAMTKEKKIDDHHCSVIEKKRLEKDIEYCNTAYDSHEDRIDCYAKAEEVSKNRETACKYS